MQDKMAEYNEELTALNEELEHHMQAEIEFKLKEELLVQQKKQSEEMTMLLVKTLSDTIEAKDEYTIGHSNRVSEYAAINCAKHGAIQGRCQKNKVRSYTPLFY